MSEPINDAVVGAFAAFVHGGKGPTHSALSRVFVACGCSDVDPFDEQTRTPNKEQRVLRVGLEANRRAGAGKKFTEGMLEQLRLAHVFSGTAGVPNNDFSKAVEALRSELNAIGWRLSEDGRLESQGEIDFATGGRAALDEQVERLRRNSEDPAALIGTSKDLVEAVCKYVLEEVGRLPSGKHSLDALLALTFEALEIRASVASGASPGSVSLRSIYGSAEKILKEVGKLRNAQGTGHGRTRVTDIPVEAARFVVGQVVLVCGLILSTHDRKMGRSG